MRLRRHTALSTGGNNETLQAVADLLGHSSISITGDIYGHASDDAARSAIDSLGGRLGVDVAAAVDGHAVAGGAGEGDTLVGARETAQRIDSS